MDAPNVDGLIFVNADEMLMSGDFVRVKVTGAAEYDLPLFYSGSPRGKCPAHGRFPPDRKSTRLNSSHITRSRMPSSA